MIFFESQRIYDMPELFLKGGVPRGDYEVPFGEPDIKKAGKDLTILTIGATLYRALEAAKELEEKTGVSCEVIDARSHRAVQLCEGDRVGEEDPQDCAGLRRLRARQRPADDGRQDHAVRVRRAGRPAGRRRRRNWITPADEVEDAFFPFPADILDAVHEHILPLRGYAPARECSDADLLRRSAEGV